MTEFTVTPANSLIKKYHAVLTDILSQRWAVLWLAEMLHRMMRNNHAR